MYTYIFCYKGLSRTLRVCTECFGEQNGTFKSACMGPRVGIERMISIQLGDRYSKEMGINKGESRFMGIYVQ